MIQPGEIGTMVMHPRTPNEPLSAFSARPPRTWRTRKDPFENHHERILQLLRESPRIPAKTIFTTLCQEFPGQFQEGQLRTLQRVVARYRPRSPSEPPPSALDDEIPETQRENLPTPAPLLNEARSPSFSGFWPVQSAFPEHLRLCLNVPARGNHRRPKEHR